MLVPLVCLATAALALVGGFLAGGALGWGLACGGVLGAALGGATASALRRAARHAPHKAFNTFVAGFMAKLGVLMAVGLAYAVHPPLTERLDPRSLLLSYAGAALIVLGAGIHVARNELREGARRSATPS